MEEYIELIEKFLRGQMSLEEEDIFKASLNTVTQLRSLAFIVAYFVQKQKNW